MTKRHFEAIALALKERREMYRNPINRAIVDQTARHLADVFAAENPRFDRARFLKACGVES